MRRRGRDGARRGLLAGLATLLVLALLGIGAAGASAAPWSCDSFGYLYQASGAATSSEILRVDLATGMQSPYARTSTAVVNAVGHNPVDGYYYGIAGTIGTHRIARINADGTLDDLGFPAAVDDSVGYPVGDVDANGHYWLASPGVWYEIDLTTPTPTVLRRGAITLPAGITTAGNDWSFIDGALYSVGQNSGPTAFYLIRFDPATGRYANLGVLRGAAGRVPTGGIGATFSDASGYLYASQNSNGDIYRVDPRTRQSILASSQGASSASNDGARCAAAVVPTITTRKLVDGRVRPADQFTVALVESGGRLLDSATTSGTATSAATTNWPVSQGHTYTITDAMASGSPTPIGEYVRSIECVDATGAAAATGGSAGAWTLTVADATFYTCTVTNRARADLALSKTAAPSPAVPGTNETYMLRVTNHGPSSAVGTRVSDPLPSALTFVSASRGCTETGGTVTCLGGDLAPGASRTFRVTARVASSVKSCARLRNTATATSATPDPDPSDNSDSACPLISGRADLSIVKTPAARQIAPGGQIMYTLLVRNTGPSDASGVRVEDPLAAGLTLVSAKPGKGRCTTAGGRVSCELGTLEAGGSTQVLVTATAPTPNACTTNTATVSGDQRDPDLDDNSDAARICTTPLPEPTFDLVVTKRAARKTVTVGQTLTYRIVVRNTGPDAAPDASVTDTYSSKGKVVSVGTTQGTCVRRMPLRCQLGTIRAGGRATITVKLRPTDPGHGKRNTASVTGHGRDGDPSDNVDGVVTKVRRVHLRLRKVASRRVVRAGETFSYAIRVSNPTGGIARHVRVCDRLPSGVVYVGARPKARLAKGARCWTIRRLAAHRHRTLRMTVRALDGAAGRKVNRALASSPDARTARGHSVVRVLAAPARGATPVTG